MNSSSNSTRSKQKVVAFVGDGALGYVMEYVNALTQAVCAYMPNRTCSQCMHRWEKVVRPGIRKGLWSVSEDVDLITWAEVRKILKMFHMYAHTCVFVSVLMFTSISVMIRSPSRAETTLSQIIFGGGFW